MTGKTGTNRSGRLVALLVMIAIAERAAWAVLRPDAGVAGGEAFMVARAIAEGRGFADAYRVGQGPTAHLLPISPTIAGVAYRLLGIDSPAARAVLSAWGIACAVGSYLLLYRAFGRLGVSAMARLAALGVLCVAPVYLTQEAFDFRAWEGGLAVLLAAAFLNRLTLCDAGPWQWRGIVEVAAVAAVAFFVNPVIGLAAYAAGAVSMLRRGRLGCAVGAGVLAAALLAVLLVPWAVRNERMLGSPVLLRSNAGLELALANRPDAVDGIDQGSRYIARLEAIHPHLSPTAYRAMQSAGGEVAYSHRLGDDTRRWLEDHPAIALRLMVRHVRQFLFPPAWAFKPLDTDRFAATRSLLVGAVMLLCLLTLGDRIRRTGAGWWYPAIMVLVPALASAPFQPIARYCYIVYALAMFCAADGIGRAIAVLRARRINASFRVATENPPPTTDA